MKVQIIMVEIKVIWSDYHTKIGTDISQSRLDDAVNRVLSSMYRLDQLN